MRPRCPIFCHENREQHAALEGLKPSPKPLSDALKCRERLRAVNRSGPNEDRLVNRFGAGAASKSLHEA